MRSSLAGAGHFFAIRRRGQTDTGLSGASAAEARKAKNCADQVDDFHVGLQGEEKWISLSRTVPVFAPLET
jgi:hypothetical protein